MLQLSTMVFDEQIDLPIRWIVFFSLFLCQILRQPRNFSLACHWEWSNIFFATNNGASLCKTWNFHRQNDNIQSLIKWRKKKNHASSLQGSINLQIYWKVSQGFTAMICNVFEKKNIPTLDENILEKNTLSNLSNKPKFTVQFLLYCAIFWK